MSGCGILRAAPGLLWLPRESRAPSLPQIFGRARLCKASPLSQLAAAAGHIHMPLRVGDFYLLGLCQSHSHPVTFPSCLFTGCPFRAGNNVSLSVSSLCLLSALCQAQLVSSLSPTVQNLALVHCIPHSSPLSGTGLRLSDPLRA